MSSRIRNPTVAWPGRGGADRVKRHPLATPKWTLPDGGGTTARLTREAVTRRVEENLDRADGASWGEIAGGHHVRALVDRARFEAAAAARAAEPTEQL